MPANDDLIWIVEASVLYRRSREWLDQQVREGRLTKYTVAGDKRIYLSREELEKFFAPRPSE